MRARRCIGANAHRAATKNAAGGKPPTEPEFDGPVAKLNNQSWRLNRIAEGYAAKANTGSRESPLHIMINVPRSVAKRVEGYDIGEIWITPDTATYSKKVPRVKRPVPSVKSTVAEPVADVGRVNGPPKNIIAADLNAGNITAGDGSTMVQFDLSKSINRTIPAKKRNMYNTAYGHTRDGIKYKSRTGRGVSHEREEECLARGESAAAVDPA